MECQPIVTGSRPSCFWGPDLATDNRQFLSSLDPGYFRFVALTHAGQLDGDERHRAALALRTAHGQAIETLFALLAACAQAPRFPLGWLLRYKVVELKEVVQAISAGRPFPNLVVAKPVTWEALSKLVHSHIAEPIRIERKLAERFARLWHRLARTFATDDFVAEYNSLKHGLRVTPGGFSLWVGEEEAPGQPAAPEDMRAVGGCEFGSSFFEARRIPEAQGHDASLSHVSRNWRPEALALDLQLIAQSARNVISFLQGLAGEDTSKVRFAWPADEQAFERYGDFLVSIETMSTGPTVTADDIGRISREEILADYAAEPGSEAQVDPPQQ